MSKDYDYDSLPFVHEGQLLVLNEERTEEVPFAGPWPVAVWLLAEDGGDGNGWERSRLEAFGEVLEDFPHDHDCQAVLLAVKSQEAFVRLFGRGEGCFGYDVEDEVPASPLSS